MRIIDAHAHTYDILAGYGARGECRPIGRGLGRWATGEVERFFPEEYGDLGFAYETLIRLMDENGVDRAILLQGGNYGFHNDYAFEAAQAHPDRFTAVGTLDPYGSNAEAILDRFIREYGFRALKFEVSDRWGLTGYHPDLQMDGAVFAPILERCNTEQMTVTIDMGPMGTGGFRPESMVRIAKMYPAVQFVMTHCFFPLKGDCARNPERLDRMKELADAGFLFDISTLPLFCCPDPYPFTYIQDFLREAKKRVCAERMLWGTDLPSTFNNFTYAEMKDYIPESGIFTDGELELVMGENAARAYRVE